MQQANFEVTDRDVYVHFETEPSENRLGRAQLPPMKGVVVEDGGIDAGEPEAWGDDINERAEKGEYFFSFNQHFFTAKKHLAEA